MFKQYIALFLIIAISIASNARNDNDSIPKESTPHETVYGPAIGLGVGMFKFYGDILDANNGNPLISNIGYDLHVKQRLTPSFNSKFYVLFGTLSANERSSDRNLNFRSNITVGGFSLEYNFDALLPKKRIINPYISLGIESVEFLSKTDLYDQYGNEYHYWSDGSIKNMAEDDPNAADAIRIQRDYTFETDLREMNYDDKGKYSERTFSIPFGVGAIMHLSENIDFTIGATYHYTFSDLIDNVVEESDGERIGNHPGNKGTDKFLMSSFSVSYNFLKHKKQEEVQEFEPEEEIDYLAYDNADEDGDGVIDFIDQCPWTPEGVKVDENGCPLDKDKDLVPNYKDDELETRENAPVSPNGVELTDTMIYIAYQKYLDSTGAFAEIETRLISAERKKKTYKVQVGSYTEAIDADLVDNFLSIPDVEFRNFGDSLTVIAVGDYNNLPDAIKRKIQLTEQGFDAAIVVQEENNGTLVSVGDEANNMIVENLNDNINTHGLIFRVQLGAFSKRLPKTAYKGLKNIMEIKADDGLYKYLYTGSFKTIEEAASKKLDLAIDYGVKDAFIVAYKDGKRISLQEAGVNSTVKEKGIKKSEDNFNKSAVKFQVQIGSYKEQLPIEVLSKFMEIENIEQTSIANNLTRYTSGNFTSYKEAIDHRNELIGKGFGTAFVIALHNDDLIPVSKAKELSGE